MKYPNSRIILLTRAPEPGQVKTRLISSLGAEEAAAIYRQFLEQTLEMLGKARLAPLIIYCSPSTAHPWFQKAMTRYGASLHQQSTGDLGQRMDDAIKTTLVDSESCVLVGGDCPTLQASDIDQALSALANNSEAVLGPALDGGYYLLGAKRALTACLTEIEWSSPAVFTETVKRLDRDRIIWHRLSVRDDIDTMEDYERYLTSENVTL